MPVVKGKAKTDKNLCRMVTPPFIVSYPHVVKPNRIKATDPLKYSLTALFDKNKDLTGYRVTEEMQKLPIKLQDIIKNAKLAAFGPKEFWPAKISSPVSDGDDTELYPDKPENRGHWVVKAGSNEDQKPVLVDRNGRPITEQADFYPGCKAEMSVYAYVWEYMGKYGVSLILDHVRKVGDGKNLTGKKSADQVFAPLSDDETFDEEQEEAGF